MTTDELATEVIEAAEASQDVAEALRAVADAGDRLLASGLTKRALIVLLRDKTGLSMGGIRLLLEALPALRGYTKPRPKQ